MDGSDLFISNLMAEKVFTHKSLDISVDSGCPQSLNWAYRYRPENSLLGRYSPTGILGCRFFEIFLNRAGRDSVGSRHFGKKSWP